MTEIRELDVVQLTADQPSGLVEGARGAVVSVYEGGCTVEFTDADGFTMGLFEIPTSDLRVVEYLRPRDSVAREE